MVMATCADQTRTCTIVTLEMLFTARDTDAVGQTQLIESSLPPGPCDRLSPAHRDRRGARPLTGWCGAHIESHHPDILIAATAQDAGIGVLHYDHHYDRLAEVLNFRKRLDSAAWLALPLIAGRDPPQVDRGVVELGVDALLERDLTQRAA
jgi:predicted nucleic acid-binding protein